MAQGEWVVFVCKSGRCEWKKLHFWLYVHKLRKNIYNNVYVVSDNIVHNCISGKIDLENNKQATVVPLYARYLKRIGSHLKNISTTMVNPYEYIGYRKQ